MCSTWMSDNPVSVRSTYSLMECALLKVTHEAKGVIFVAQQVGKSPQT